MPAPVMPDPVRLIGRSVTIIVTTLGLPRHRAAEMVLSIAWYINSECQDLPLNDRRWLTRLVDEATRERNRYPLPAGEGRKRHGSV